MELRQNIPLAPLTTLEVGGSARFFVRANSSEEVHDAVEFARARRLRLFVLGGGSNVVIADRGWDGLVLQIAITGIDRQQDAFHVGAGETWDAFVGHAVALNYAGLECLSGIPGTVGGTPVQNVGAYGQEVSQTITSVLVFDTDDNRIYDLSAKECGFAYRASIFNGSALGRFIVMRVSFGLVPGGPPSLRYADLQKEFESRDVMPTLSDVRRTIKQIRRAKGMLIDANDPQRRTVGSFFKNPVLSAEEFHTLAYKANERGLSIPSYPQLEQQHKVSAAWLVEHSGFAKGFRLCNVGISSKHALALVNLGGATTGEILALKDQIQDRVQTAWGIRLEPEPVLVGF